MARTKASVGAKVSSGKSSKARCSVAPTPSPSGSAGGADRGLRTSGGNPVCHRETPKWQRPITNFFITKETNGRDTDSEDTEIEVAAGSSKTKPKRNVIESDEDEEIEPERPKNSVLDESIELLPLTGEDSHKLDEYYPKNEEKGKGKGKKTKNKENIDTNTRNSFKRDLDVTFGEEVGHTSKRIKV